MFFGVNRSLAGCLLVHLSYIIGVLLWHRQTIDFMKKLFTLATGRTGTTFLAHFFNQVTTNSIARGEDKPAFLRRGYELVSRDSTVFERFYFKIYRELRMRKYQDKVWFMDTNNRLFSCANKIIREVYPDARVYQVVRDGRDVVRSWMNRGRYFPADKGRRLTPAMVPNDPFLQRWDSMNALQKISWNWVTNNRIIEEQGPDDLYFFEGFFSSPYSEMYRLLDSLEGLEYDRATVDEALTKIINPSPTYVFPKYPDWPELWKEQFWEVAGETMEHYGYKQDAYGQPSIRMGRDNVGGEA